MSLIYPEFTPLSVAQLALWYKGDSGVTMNGANVSSWANKATGTGAINNAIQATGGSQPARGTVAVNGVRGITFSNGKDFYIEPSTLTLLNAAPGVTIFAVVKSSTGLQQNIFGIAQGNASSDSLRAGMYITSSNTIRFDGSRTDSVSFPSGVEGGTHTTVLEVLHVTWHLATRTVTVYQNGIEVALNTNYSTAGSTFDATNPSSACVGQYIFFHGDALAGDLFELLLWERALTVADQTLIKNYLSEKYGVTLA